MNGTNPQQRQVLEFLHTARRRETVGPLHSDDAPLDGGGVS